MSKEFERVSRTVGKEGKTAQRASMGTVLGSWNTSVDSVNSLIGDLVQPSTEMARVIGAVAKGDLTQTMPLEVDRTAAQGRIPAHGPGGQHHGGAAERVRREVTRVAREVGTEGNSADRPRLKASRGLERPDRNVNSMAGNLTTRSATSPK